MNEYMLYDWPDYRFQEGRSMLLNKNEDEYIYAYYTDVDISDRLWRYLIILADNLIPNGFYDDRD